MTLHEIDVINSRYEETYLTTPISCSFKSHGFPSLLFGFDLERWGWGGLSPNVELPERDRETKRDRKILLFKLSPVCIYPHVRLCLIRPIIYNIL